jgi:hypothetical protein
VLHPMEEKVIKIEGKSIQDRKERRFILTPELG